MNLGILNDILSSVDSMIGGSQWFVFLLLGTGLFFTIYLKFPQVRYFRRAIKIVSGKDREAGEGDTSPFQALSTALSGTVGTGNIAGVALAIHLGGPAALFWMVVTAMLGMTTKFVEVTLSHKYREKTADGTMAGGPMYYMKNKLNMKWLAIIFAIATILSSFGTGNMPQINSISNSLYSTFGINQILTGAVLAILLGFVIIGGIKRIASITSKLVPTMAVFYLVGALAVIIYNYDNIIPSIISIFSDVFTGTAATGGFIGAGIAFAFNKGVNRGLFSNEAGQGSAPIAHASSNTKSPVEEGMVAILEPFIDTIIICSLTGLVLLSSGVWKDKIENTFQHTDMVFFEEVLDDNDQEDRKKIVEFLSNGKGLKKYTGIYNVKEGLIQEEISLLHAESIAEDVIIKRSTKDNLLYSGPLTIKKGKIIQPVPSEIKVIGKSLIHSAPLTAHAFTKSIFGSYGEYIVSIGLLLFAFSTAISWSYYGGRAMTFLFGTNSVKYYRIVYVVGFFLASFIDTTIIWTLSGITVALMTLPNLIGILMLRKDMKGSIREYFSAK